ncbi:hypothetical protein FGB62_17g343 [Gracilaria domingensis]|nr:hypothetical protein FGB62_17g343 [Gracilaria domingensis]
MDGELDGEMEPRDNVEGFGGREEGTVAEGVSCCVTSLESGVRRGLLVGRGFSGLDWAVEHGGGGAGLVMGLEVNREAGCPHYPRRAGRLLWRRLRRDWRGLLWSRDVCAIGRRRAGVQRCDGHGLRIGVGAAFCWRHPGCGNANGRASGGNGGRQSGRRSVPCWEALGESCAAAGGKQCMHLRRGAVWSGDGAVGQEGGIGLHGGGERWRGGGGGERGRGGKGRGREKEGEGARSRGSTERSEGREELRSGTVGARRANDHSEERQPAQRARQFGATVATP